MRVLVAGATGALGQPLVRELVRRGHEVVGLSRSEENDATLKSLGATPVRGSLFDPADTTRAAAGCEAVVRVATHIAMAPKPEDWRMNDRIRVEGTAALLAAAQAVGARYVQESVVWAARPPDGSPFDESSPTLSDEVVGSAIEAERLAQASGVPAATLRLGWLRGPTAQERMFMEMLRSRKLPLIAGGKAPLAFLHVEDAARAFADAVEHRVEGIYHVVDDEPVTLASFFGEMARRAGARPPISVPRFVGRLFAGAWLTRFLTTPMLTDAKRFKARTGWRPREG